MCESNIHHLSLETMMLCSDNVLIFIKGGQKKFKGNLWTVAQNNMVNGYFLISVYVLREGMQFWLLVLKEGERPIYDTPIWKVIPAALNSYPSMGAR